jgi:hypothetical protein
LENVLRVPIAYAALASIIGAFWFWPKIDAWLVRSSQLDDKKQLRVDIAAVQWFYTRHHVRSIRDKDGPKRAFSHLLAYLASVDAAGKVADLTIAHQEGFMRWCRTNGGYPTKPSARTSLMLMQACVSAPVRTSSKTRVGRSARCGSS